jgi:hypothetical protein
MVFLNQPKQFPYLNIVMDLMNALLGSSSVNTVQHALTDQAVFSVPSAPHPVMLTDKLTQSDTCLMFSVWSAPCKNRGTVFPVHGSCREDMREYGNGI